MEHIQLRMAVVAAFFASSVSQEFYDKFHFRIIIKYPSGSDGSVIGGVNQSQCVCQSAWILVDEHVKIGMLANLSGIKFFNKFRYSFMDILRTYHTEKSFKFLLVLQQRCK